ncbi:MAG: 16S rRNA (cytidine(1402)-2'-O)-methyltransferase [Patescibacteria group bacterium]|nr:16S rRNA (cytidine(1402)-2'-O)-methyltransferase [Patescibacteria group bacterium]
MGILYIVATPIGNLKDVTLRTIETFKNIDLVLAEDTRVIKRLLQHFEIKKTVWRFDEYAKNNTYREVKKLLEEGKNLAYVTDAGTPGIADPGWKLVNFLQKELPNVKIIPIPGVSAITTVFSVSGINGDQFTFLGYPPHKKGRQKFFNELKDIKIAPIVLYESPHRFQKTLDNLKQVFDDKKEIIVGRELTKIHEEILKENISFLKKYFVGERSRGEFTIIIP